MERGARTSSGREPGRGELRVLRQEASYCVAVTEVDCRLQLDHCRIVAGDRYWGRRIAHAT
jgi:hypothetical protein